MRGPVLSSHACNHNLNNLIGHLFLLLPDANLPLKANLVSVLYGAATIGLFHALLRSLGLPRLTSALGTGVLMVSHSMWWHATQVENYALSAVFLCACLWLAARDGAAAARGAPPGRDLTAFFLLAGLALFNHLQNGALALAGAAALLARPERRSRTVWLRCGLAFTLGALPCLAVLVRDLLLSDDPAATLSLAVGGGFQSLMFRYDLVSDLRRMGHWIFMQFPSPFLLCLPAGAWRILRGHPSRGFSAALLTAFGANTAFFLGYKTWDQFSFYLVSFVCLAVAGAAGAEWLRLRLRPAWQPLVTVVLAASVLLPPLVYVNIPRWVDDSPGGYWGRRYRAAHEAYRGRYDLVGLYVDPIRHDRGSVDRYIRLLLSGLPAHALVIDDVSAFYQIRLLRDLHGERPDLDFRLIQPPGMSGWGTPVPALVEEVLTHPHRAFITATNGPSAEVVAALRHAGRMPAVFRLSDRCWAFEVLPEERQESRNRQETR